MTENLTTAPQPAQVDAPSEDDGVIRLGGGSATPVPMAPLFSIEGKTYKIPTVIRPNVALKILAKFEADGPMAAEIFMLRTVLGNAAFDALINFEGLEESDLKAITDKVMTMTFAAVEKDSGKLTERLAQIAWVAHYLDDLESDFSALHGIYDMYALPAPRFFRMAWRMSAYKGVMRMRVMEQQDSAESAPARSSATAPTRRHEDAPQEMDIAAMMIVNPGLIERVSV